MGEGLTGVDANAQRRIKRPTVSCLMLAFGVFFYHLFGLFARCLVRIIFLSLFVFSSRPYTCVLDKRVFVALVLRSFIHFLSLRCPILVGKQRSYGTYFFFGTYASRYPGPFTLSIS